MRNETTGMGRGVAGLCAAICSAVPLSGCQDAARRAFVGMYYREAHLPARQMRKDIPYRTDSDAHPRKHTLDLYIPDVRDWPVLLFVHGGRWSSGDKALEFAGADPYANIGRFYALRGIGVAVINYRLQPSVTWQEQVDDVARALAWVRSNAERYGGNPRAVFLFGHSAGAHLATSAALDEQRLDRLGLPQESICGVIAASGTPFDITDAETYRLGMDPAFFERHFRDSREGDAWKTEASPVSLVKPSAPPFLLLHGRWEWKSLQRQNEVMRRTLAAAGILHERVITPWDGHFVIIGSLSHPCRRASAAVIDFVNRTVCNAEPQVVAER